MNNIKWKVKISTTLFAIFARYNKYCLKLRLMFDSDRDTVSRIGIETPKSTLGANRSKISLPQFWHEQLISWTV